ncbi:hypothetical protein MRX96_035578 [Rhipicephalus microplus]
MSTCPLTQSSEHSFKHGLNKRRSSTMQKVLTCPYPFRPTIRLVALQVFGVAEPAEFVVLAWLPRDLGGHSCCHRCCQLTRFVSTKLDRHFHSKARLAEDKE